MADFPSHIPFTESGSYRPRAGNSVRPLIDGVPAFRRICAAIEAARRSVWVTVAFIDPDFTMPDGKGTLFDVLDRAVSRGLDVRAIFWRPPEGSAWAASAFPGSPDQRDMLRARRSRFRARWDCAGDAICHHQKSWLLDAGQSSETAFVGGMNLNPRVVVSPGHRDGGWHDAYVEVRGPAATDVHHNFVQRWNEASERREVDGTWAHDGQDDLAFPSRLSAPKGTVIVQIQRTVHPGRYRDGTPSPGAAPLNIAGGERSILTQYLQAIGAARRSIYIENQAIEMPEIVAALDGALTRGVDVVALVPAEPDSPARPCTKPGRGASYKQLAALWRHAHFALVGIAGPDAAAGRRNVYVHAKIMLIDDAWATIGSCNLHAGSLSAQTELNVSFWDSTSVRALRSELFAEHLDHDTTLLDDRKALGLYRQTAHQNRLRRDVGDFNWQGLAFRLDPTTESE